MFGRCNEFKPSEEIVLAKNSARKRLVGENRIQVPLEVSV
jgi:hypothetical protein